MMATRRRWRTILAAWPKASRTSTPALDFAPLEDRILLSASPLPLPVDDAVDGSSAGPSEDVDAEVPVEEALDVGLLGFPGPGAPDELRFSDATPGDGDGLLEQYDGPSKLELVFIDPSTRNHERLVEDLLEGASPERDLDIYLRDGTGDGLQQISDILAGYSNVDALHLVSHAEPGRVDVGGLWLDDGNLAEHADTLRAWRGSLRPRRGPPAARLRSCRKPSGPGSRHGPWRPRGL